ncbi:marine proteobacterial sortase target protein [Sinorhizobium terangae]|uniref:Marine proteobacterial sortase target protein n=1 Tax=Sinorhizobium terangae TaxID=110322 RepID=A0A6N7LHN1_SINTE|nr:marine proteobacterial sortase target protein [Sinorhizobium terangae]MBB4185375.1 Ca-activated chloride channel family protein [Sinorhizobium terangae]MQX17391.1 marine proteobacterial sortase target protein [Sinorhizobium terangae]WFU46547.1 marine proteobacterial sortase target protein [Sinorhizobium terangae]
MFFDDEIATARTRHNEARWGFYLALAALAACIVMILGLLAQASAQAAEPRPQRLAGYVRPNDMGTGTLLFPSREPGYFVEAPRLATDVEINVNGPIMRTRVTQRFENPSKGWVEGTYVFPLPEDSAVDTLKMQIGDRFIEGKIKRRAEAKEIYEQAKAEGKKAALLEQQRPNIFTNQVANIGPGETIVVQIEYQSGVRQSNGVFSFRFPMVVAPRYNPQPIVNTVDIDGRSGYAVSEPVPDREKIEAPVLDPKENAKVNPVTLTVNLKAGFPIASVSSPYHEVEIASLDELSRRITLKNGSVPADKDFELSWKAIEGKSPYAGLFRETVGGKTYLLAFVTPPSAVEAGKAVKREVVFVIDNSGSMAGPSMEQAKESLALAISRLNNDDRFNVIRFDDTMTVHFPELVAATPDKREDAIAFVRALTAEGGTEMLPALEAALRTQGPVQPGALRQVIFLTDGAIGNESQLFDEIRNSRGDARVFTVGIGSAPNSHFMTKAAEYGRGTFTLIGSESEVASRMVELFEKLENPVMTEISAAFDGIAAADITPDPMPDLYRGEPVVLTAELAGAAPEGKLRIVGKAGDQPWRVEMDIAKAAPGEGIAKLWARRKIDDLEASAAAIADPAELDRQIETVALAHHLVSRVTSLVAVDVTPSRPAGEPLAGAKVPLNLPEGWDFGKVFGENPADPGKIDEREAAGDRSERAMLVADRMAAAPTARAATLIAEANNQVNLPQTATEADRQILIGLMLLAIALLAGTTFAFWREQIAAFIVERVHRHG